LFGEIIEKKVVLNEGGKIAEQCWQDIPKHFPHVTLHEYVVMPNHIHGIIEILTENENGNDTNNVGAENFLPLRANVDKRNKFQKIIPRSVGSIVRGYKIGVTKWYRQNTHLHNIWQRNYYEHIIRNGEAYEKISQYIHDNPIKWQDDKFYPAI
jgi:REP element-mobilizing transposase RayT